MFKKTFYFIGLTILMVVLAACSNEDSTESSSGGGDLVTISGSTSVGPLAEKLAAKYEETEDVKIEINQIGSSAGITNAINDVSQIGMSSRDLKQEEIDSGIQESSLRMTGLWLLPTHQIRLKI